MKNKTKKILAAAFMGIMGAATLTGCSMSDEQKDALDKVVSKTDEIIELVDSNMTMQNAKLTKEEAAEKILLARNYFYNPTINVKLSYNKKSFTGFYDNVAYESTLTSILDNKSEGVSKVYFAESSINYANNNERYATEQYVKNDCKNNIYYAFDDVDDDFDKGDYSLKFSSGMRTQMDVLSVFEGLQVITPEMINDLNIIENGYKFTVYGYDFGENYVSKSKLTITIQNDIITNTDIEFLEMRIDPSNIPSNLSLDADGNYVDPAEYVIYTFLNSGDYTDIMIDTYNVTYEYDIDMSSIDVKLAEIEAEYLTNN